MGPAGAAAVGTDDEMLGVAGVFFSEEDVKSPCFKTAVPSHGIGELGRRDFKQGCVFRNVDFLNPGRLGRQGDDESEGKKE